MIIKEIERQPVYFDANIVIFHIEGDWLRKEKAKKLVNILSENDNEIFISEIGISECLYGAYKNNKEALELYFALFNQFGWLNAVSINDSIMRSAAFVGVDKNLKIVDAVHYVTAILAKCKYFFTNDRAFKSTDDLKVIYLDELDL